MKTTNLKGMGNSRGNAAISMLQGDLRQLLSAYSNVTYIASYDIATNKVRDVYAIEGFEAYYIYFEATSGTSAYHTMGVCLRGNEDTNTVIVSLLTGTNTTTQVENIYTLQCNCYTFSKNNILYGLLFDYNDTTPNGYIAFNIQDSGNYICFGDRALFETAGGAPYYINYTYPQGTYSVAEKAIKVKPMITATQTSGSSAIIDMLDNVYKFINAAFNTMYFTLIEVNGVRYRQVYQRYLFLEDGDEE